MRLEIGFDLDAVRVPRFSVEAVEGIGTAPGTRKIRPEAKALDLKMLRGFSMIRRDEVRDQVVNLVHTLARAGR